jgi:hypothetical protein
MRELCRTIRVFAVLAVLIGANSANAFIFLKGTTFQKGERPVSAGPIWPGRTVTFYVNTDMSAMGGSLALPVTGVELLQAVQESVKAWTVACRADLRVSVAGTTTGTYNANDGTNVIQWDNRTTGEGNYYGAATSTLAAATTVLKNFEFADCDIVLNGNSSTTMKFTPAMGEADLRSIITHEIGHCLGLDHPIEPPDYTSVDPFITDATMVQTAATGLDPSDPGRRDIAQDDRDGIECLYERGKPFRTGLHCGSYTGTNGQGALTGAVVGGPTVVDTGCGGDAQGRNANPSVDSGDGCITAAVAGTAKRPGPSPAFSPLRALGGTWGFLFGVAVLLISRVLRRRWLLAGIVVLLTSLSVPSARAVDVELTYGARKISPSTWNSFSGMDPGATAWARAPSETKMSTLSEIRATAFSEFTDWGKWGGSLSIVLPTKLETNAKATGASEQSKSTTLSGFRLGPDFRWFPAGTNHPVKWFVGGRVGLGIFYGSQSFSSTTAGSVSYRAWSTELAATTGAEIPLGGITLVIEGGYSRYRSSYFASTGNDGTAYTDFPSGTRLSTNTGGSNEDVRFDGSGLFATVGLQMAFGSSGTATRATPAPEPAPTAIPAPIEAPRADPVPTFPEFPSTPPTPYRGADPVPSP